MLERTLAEDRLKSKEIIELKQIINGSKPKSKVYVEVNPGEEITVPAKKGQTSVNFIFTHMETYNRKSPSQSKKSPFLPPFETGQFITDLSETHRLLYNKRPVVDNHLLIVTSSFEEQTDPLNLHDFSAAYKVLLTMNGVCYFNSGRHSGSTQPHKHLQWIPKPKEDKSEIVTLLDEEVILHEKPFRWPIYSFAHLIAPLPNFEGINNYDEIGARLVELYLEMMENLKIKKKIDSHNLVMDEKWMMVVKRSKENTFHNINVNAIAFAGRISL